MVTMPRNIKNSANELSTFDFPQAVKKSYNDVNFALDVVSVDTLVHERFYAVSCSYITLPNDDIEVETITYYGLGVNQLQYIDIPAYPAGKGEITLLSFSGQTPGALDGKYFTIYDSSGSVGVWFDLDGISVHPTTGADRDISVSIATGDDTSALATKLANKMSLDPEFYSTTAGFNVAIITISVGNKTNSSAGTSGLIMTSQDGIASMNNTWFKINTIEDKQAYYLWYDVAGAGVDPTPIVDAIAIPVALIGNETDDQIAQKTADGLNSISELYLSASIDGNRVVVRYGRMGTTSGIINGNTRNTISTRDLGTTRPVVAKLLVTYGANNEIAFIERITIGENTN